MIKKVQGFAENLGPFFRNDATFISKKQKRDRKTSDSFLKKAYLEKEGFRKNPLKESECYFLDKIKDIKKPFSPRNSILNSFIISDDNDYLILQSEQRFKI